MAEARIVIAAFSALFGGARALIAAWPLLRKQSVYQSFRSVAEKISAARTSPEEDHWKHIIVWLEFGDHILLQVRHRVLSRLLVLTGIAIASGSFIAIDFPNHLLNSPIKSIELHDFGVLALLWVIPYLTFLKRFVFTEDEKEFLSNLDVLQKHYYDEFTVGSMREFNKLVNETLFVAQEERERSNEELASTFRSIMSARTGGSMSSRSRKK